MAKSEQMKKVRRQKIPTKTDGIPKIFPKSRVPVSFILDYFKEGLTKYDFYYSYPWINLKDIDSVLIILKKHCLI